MSRKGSSSFGRLWLIAAFALALALLVLRATSNAVLDDRVGATDRTSGSQGTMPPGEVFRRDPLTNTSTPETRGRSFLCVFDNPSNVKATSFIEPAQLAAWGWTKTELHGFEITGELDDYARQFQAKGIDIESPTMKGIRWVHDTATKHGNRDYPATGGEYNILFDSEQGLIVPTLSYGPAWQIEKGNVRKTWPQGAPLPDLRQWSDIAYLTWIQYSTNENRQKLSMVVNVDCESELTRSIVVEALKKDGVKSGIPPKWPGHTFSPGKRKAFLPSSDGPYVAVLGTPNLLGSGWLVLQHDALGKKKIGEITVYDSSEGESDADEFQLSIMVEVVDR